MDKSVDFGSGRIEKKCCVRHNPQLLENVITNRNSLFKIIGRANIIELMVTTQNLLSSLNNNFFRHSACTSAKHATHFFFCATYFS